MVMVLIKPTKFKTHHQLPLFPVRGRNGLGGIRGIRVNKRRSDILKQRNISSTQAHGIFRAVIRGWLGQFPNEGPVG